MNRKRRIWGFAVILAAVVLAALFYTRPMTIKELLPGIDFENGEQMQILVTVYPESSADPTRFEAELNPEDGEHAEILDALRDRTFRRSLLSLLGNRGSTHPIESGDFRWTISCSFPGGYMTLDNFFGRLTLTGDDVYAVVSTPDREDWCEEIRDLLLTYSINRS